MEPVSTLTERFRAARRDPELVVLEGFHAVKHAMRFGADLREVVVSNEAQLGQLTGEFAPDLSDRLHGIAVPVAEQTFASLMPRRPQTGLAAIAVRPSYTTDEVLADSGNPVVLLENPRNLGNLGACVRVAAAAEAAGVISTGTTDPWHPDVIRGAAGLHFAVPVLRISELTSVDRPVVAIDPAGDDLIPERLPKSAVLAFGTERHGLTNDLLAQADRVVGIPMRPGVSSLNLATTVATVLFAWRLTGVASTAG